MFCSFFTKGEVFDWPTASSCDTTAFATFFKAMLEEGVYLAPSQFETAFMSISHSQAEIDATITAAAKCFKLLA
jgi:glutamate-1-semialdehyde 2,1-aminomutase